MCSKSKLPSGVFIMDNENNIWKFIYSSVHALLLHGDENTHITGITITITSYTILICKSHACVNMY